MNNAVKRTNYSKLKNVLDSPNEKEGVPKVSIHDFDVSQKVVRSDNYSYLNVICAPQAWKKTAGTFL
jgi:hypothetical protein|uniref:Uncharacterized protein n=1 Tax=viral metagenome TaxID=1070528 RepID=A0A6C0KTD8_9ZZZZ